MITFYALLLRCTRTPVGCVLHGLPHCPRYVYVLPVPHAPARLLRLRALVLGWITHVTVGRVALRGLLPRYELRLRARYRAILVTVGLRITALPTPRTTPRTRLLRLHFITVYWFAGLRCGLYSYAFGWFSWIVELLLPSYFDLLRLHAVLVYGLFTPRLVAVHAVALVYGLLTLRLQHTHPGYRTVCHGLGAFG